jgi:hypothetical protein
MRAEVQVALAHEFGLAAILPQTRARAITSKDDCRHLPSFELCSRACRHGFSIFNVSAQFRKNFESLS